MDDQTSQAENQDRQQLSFRLTSEKVRVLKRAMRVLGAPQGEFIELAIMEKAHEVLSGARKKRDISENILAYVVRLLHTVESRIPASEIEDVRRQVRGQLYRDFTKLGLVTERSAAAEKANAPALLED